MKRLLWFVLTLFAFIVVLSPTVAVFTPPDPFTQLRALGVVAVVAVPIAIGFVRQSGSLRRLGAYLLVVNVLVVPLTLMAVGFEAAARSLVGRIPVFDGLTAGVAILTAYALAFHLVYRGGYARLKARFA